MALKHFHLLLALAVAVADGCNSPNDEVVRSFEKTTKQLDSAARAFNSSHDPWIEVQKYKNMYPAIVQRADAAHSAVVHALDVIDSFNNLLIAKGTDQPHTAFVTKLMANRRFELRMNALFTEVYRQTTQVATTAKRTLVASELKMEMQNCSKPGWAAEYFADMPNVAAITNLSLFRAHITYANKEAQASLLDSLKGLQ